MCGEQPSSYWKPLHCMGSPPRVRGTGGGGSQRAQGAGITPACAGNSCRFSVWRQVDPDHPRVCGEQKQAQRKATRMAGSPPRVRGTVGVVGDADGVGGITPACAGNRSNQFLCQARYRDHPRVCGEQQQTNQAPLDYLGSPPRVRGTVQPPPAADRHRGITPACAGNSHPSAGRKRLFQDHPRVCGEQNTRNLLKNFFLGSPPRVRGTARRAV